MPAVAAYLASTAFTIGGVAISVGTLVQVAVVVGSVASKRRQARKAAAASVRAYNASLTDHQLMIQSAIAPRTSTYGSDKVSGPLVYAESTGSKKQYLHLVIPVNGRRAHAIDKVFFNEIELPAPDGSGFIQSGDFAKTIVHSETQTAAGVSSIVLAHVPDEVITVTASSGSGDGETVVELSSPSGYTLSGSTITLTGGAVDKLTVNYEWTEVQSKVRIKKHLGQPGQVADADLVAESDGKWTSAHVGVGVAYIYVRLEYDQEVFGQIGLPAIAVGMRGNLVWDPRSSTTAWSDNTALCTADYMRDALLGMGCTAAQVPDAELTTAANICDEAVALDAVPTTHKRYTFNGTLTSAAGRMDNLETLLQPMAGTAVWVQGRWLMRAGAHRSHEFTLDESWLARPGPKLVPRAPRGELFNAVSGKFIDPAQAYTEVDFPPVLNATYEAADGGRRIFRSIPMVGVNDPVRAQRLAKIELERARQALTVTLTCNLRAYDTLPTQVGRLTLARYGWVNKLFEVRRRSLDLQSRTVELTLRETASAVWDWAYGEATVRDPAPDTTLPSWSALPPKLTGLAVASGTTHLLKLSDGSIITRGYVTWTAAPDAFVSSGGSIELEWKLDEATVWQRGAPVSGDATSAYILPLDDRRRTLVRVRAVSAAGRRGRWASKSHVVVGKTSDPANVSGLTVTAIAGALRIKWARNTDPDYDTTELRRGASWASSVGLDGDADSTEKRGTTTNWAWPAPGSYTILARHRDTSGNLSNATASVAITVTATSIAVTGSGLSVAMGGGNLLPNSSFEADSDADGVPDSWGSTSFGTGLTIVRSLVSGGAVHGGKSHRLNISAVGSPPTSQLTHVVTQSLGDASPVIEGQSLVLTISARTSTLTFTGILQIQWLDAADASISIDNVAASHVFSATNVWERIVGPALTAPATAVKARARFGIRRPSTSSTVTGTMDFDAALLQIGDYPTQYAPMGEEILPGSVGTTQLALASATTTAVARSSFATANLAGGAPGDVTTTGVSLTYVNDTGGTISVQVEFSFYDAYLAGAGFISAKEMYLDQTGAVEGDEEARIEQFNVPPATGNYPGFARAWQYTIDDGDTLTCAVKLHVVGTNTACAVNVDQLVLRVTAIKR
jgi:hypothetical protein